MSAKPVRTLQPGRTNPEANAARLTQLRQVEVFRGRWLQVRLAEVKKGERFRMVEDGKQVCDAVATADGYSVSGIGAIEANVVDIMLCES